MQIRGVRVGIIKNSRGEDSIVIGVNNCITSAPSGASKGSHEVPAHRNTIKQDFAKLKKELQKISDFEFKEFEDLEKVEKLLRKKVGANTLFALEASILKAMAKEKGKELYQLLGGKKKPLLLSNTIGGGAHSHAKLKPDFQEFLVIGDKKSNIDSYKKARKLLKAKKTNDENAWQTSNDEIAIDVINEASKGIGLDVAASEFYKKGKYYYTNPQIIRTRKEQIDYIIKLIKKYKLKYIEDPLNEEDFKGFAEILKKTKGCLIVGDDLTTTNLVRVKKAIKNKSINGLIVKPNQIGSLIEVKKVIDICKKNKIKIIISHRSGETEDWTIADLAVGWKADMIKIPVVGKERLAKVDRIEKIS